MARIPGQLLQAEERARARQSSNDGRAALPAKIEVCVPECSDVAEDRVGRHAKITGRVSERARCDELSVDDRSLRPESRRWEPRVGTQGRRRRGSRNGNATL